MFAWLGGYEEGREDDPMLVIGTALDQPVMVAHSSKDHREDLQLWSALTALGMSGLAKHPIEVAVGQDPPDRVFSVEDHRWGVELTELTIEDIRQSLGPVRQFGRRLQKRVRERAVEFAHLSGRSVSLLALPDRTLPKRDGQLIDELENALLEDKGLPGDGVDLSHGLPQQLDMHGIYGEHGPFMVMANPNPGSTEITISAAVHMKVHQSEAIAALNNRVATKDDPGNDVLIVTCGLPDAYGHTCPADAAVFQLLWDAEKSGVSVLPDKPAHIKGVLIHLWGSPNLFVWGIGELPWAVPAES